MDAVEFLKERNRMCKSYDYCEECPIKNMFENSSLNSCDSWVRYHAELAVDIVEKWSVEHPAKTRQSKLLEMFPNAIIENGALVICPKALDKNVNCDNRIGCGSCARKYWIAGVE